MTCSIEECGKPVYGRGWCQKHYMRWYYLKTPRAHKPRPLPRPAEERFWPKVQKTDGCWLWTGAKSKGYGSFRPDNKTNGWAHRFAYELLVGPIPDGLHIDHLCRVPACVNPAHMEIVTLVENVLRGNSIPAVRARARKGVTS
jgi:hypothetical protein